MITRRRIVVLAVSLGCLLVAGERRLSAQASPEEGARPGDAPAHVGGPEESSRTPACKADPVWEFVDAIYKRFPDCDGLPPRAELRKKSCRDIDMAILASGCLPVDVLRGFTEGDVRIQETLEQDRHPCHHDNVGSMPDPHLAISEGSDGSLYFSCVASEVMCRRDEKWCKRWGRCSLSVGGDSCVAEKDAHCEQAEICKNDGQCIALDGECRRPCPRYDRDKYEAKLVDFDYSNLGAPWLKEASSKCAAERGEIPCEKTKACRELGFCEGHRGLCVRLGDASCRRAPMCEREGKCVWNKETGCSAMLDRDCRKSEVCEKEGRCRAGKNGTCVTDEQARKECRDDESRKLIDGECRRPPDFNCRDSRRCRKADRCRRLVQRNCDATGVCSGRFAVCIETEEYCRNRDECETEGKCGVRTREYVSLNQCHSPHIKSPASPKRVVGLPCGSYRHGGCVTTGGGCADSEACRKHGRCSSHHRSEHCRPSKSRHCLESEDCKKRGLCGLVPRSTYKVCRATKPEHCKQSEVCKTEGRCELRNGVCEKPQ